MMHGTRHVDRGALLEEIKAVCRQGQAENEPEDESIFLRNFLPIRSHYTAIDPETQLIIGDKGAGKTHLFRALSYARGRAELARIAKSQGRVVVDLERAAWLIGFSSSGQDFPPGGAIRVFAQARPPAELQTFWLGLLVGVLLRAREIEQAGLPPGLAEMLAPRSWQLTDSTRELDREQGRLFSVLDALDQDLQERNRHVFVTYDDLDRVSPVTGRLSKQSSVASFSSGRPTAAAGDGSGPSSSCGVTSTSVPPSSARTL